MAVQYARIVGIIVLLIGVLGLLLGEGFLVGSALNIDIFEDFVHLVTGALLAFVGFARWESARPVVLGIGLVYLLVGILGFIDPQLGGLLPNGYTIVDNLLHLALGIAGILVAQTARRTTVTRRARI